MQTLHDKIEVASHHAEKKMVSSYADMVKQIGTNLEDSGTTSGLIPPLVIAKQDDNLVRETQERQQRARNLVIYGIPESDSDVKENRKTHDETQFRFCHCVSGQ